MPSHQAHHKVALHPRVMAWKFCAEGISFNSIFSLKPHLLIVQTWSQRRDHDLLHATFP